MTKPSRISSAPYGFDPNYADSHMNLGRIYSATGAAEKAEMQLKAAVALAPLYVQARNALAEFYF
jgi:hypothetical protein